MDLQYGEVLVAKRRWVGKSIKYPLHCYRFRIDPVPFMFHNLRGTFGAWYKRPRVMQEKRFSFAFPELVRGKRRKLNLPDAWDDRQRSDIHTRKSWKNKKIKKQWMKAIIVQR